MANFLKERDIWRMNKGNRNWSKMVKYFQRLRVRVSVPEKAKNATKTIKGFESEGGLYEFDYDGQPMTVQVCDKHESAFAMLNTEPVSFTEILSGGVRDPFATSEGAWCGFEDSGSI